MRQHIYRIICGSLLLGLLACADNDELAVPCIAGSDVPMELNCEVSQGYSTRVNDGGFVGGDAIGVYIADYGRDGQPSELESVGNHATNVKFTFDESDCSWKGAAQLYWTDNTTAVDAYSYYPFTDYIPDVEAYPFAVNRRQDKEVGSTSMSGYEASDFLWAKASGVQPGTTIQLDHRHIMASVLVSLVEGEDFDGTWDGLDKDVQVTSTSTSTTIDLRTGTVSVLDGSQTESITPYKKGDSWRCIVVPQTVDAGLTLLSITIDGESYSFARETAMTYQPGKLHRFTIKVDKHTGGDYGFSLVDEAITAWEADDVSHQAEARVYTVVNVAEPGTLEATMNSMGLDPQKVGNLKLTGVMNETDFNYFKANFQNITALNLRELRTKRISLKEWWSNVTNTAGLEGTEYELDEYGRGAIYADDAIPHDLMNSISKLQHLILPDNVRYIGEQAFHRTGLVGTLVIPDGTKWIGSGAFGTYEHSTHLTSLVLPESVAYIGTRAFYGNDFKCELRLPDNLKYLGDYAFADCNKMYGQVHLPASLEYAGENTFSNIPLTGVAVFPAGMKQINSTICKTKVSAVYIPEGVVEIVPCAFGGMGYGGQGETFDSKVSGDIVLPNSLKRLGYGAFAGSKITSIEFSSSLQVLERDVVRNCKNLMGTVVVPEGVRTVHSGCFAGCSNLEAIVLPSTIEIIGGDDSNYSWWQDPVFSGCYSLTYLQCDAKEPPTLVGDVFGDLPYNNFTLVVPEESIEAYQQAEGWREFKRIAAYRNFVCRPQKAKVLNKGGKRDVVLNCDASQTWSVAHCPDWLHIDKTSGKGKSTFTITIDAMEHGHANRSDEITLRMGDTDVTTSFKVSQFDYEYDEDQDYTIQPHSKGNGIDIVIVGDGYDAEDIANGTYLADMMQTAEYFFDVEPYKTYRDYFNVYTAFAMSYESGIGSVTKLRDTKFDTSYGNWSHDSRISSSTDAVVFYTLDNTPVTEADAHKLTCILTANGAAYDGVTTMYGNGTAVAICPKSTMPYPNDARGIVQHEACGHAFGKMADEYVYHQTNIQNCVCICCGHADDLLDMQAIGWGWNLSLSGKAADLPWRHLLKDWRTSDIVDVWDGGYFHQRGVYRSEYNSCMNNNVPYFSTWSRELIVRRIMEYAGETYDYEQFIANDSREWGRDFTLGTRSTATEPNTPARHGAEPIFIKGAPSRNYKGRR